MNFTKEKCPLTFPPQAGGNIREGEKRGETTTNARIYNELH